MKKELFKLCTKTSKLIQKKGVETAVNLLKEFQNPIRGVVNLHPNQYAAYNSRLNELLGG